MSVTPNIAGVLKCKISCTITFTVPMKGFNRAKLFISLKRRQLTASMRFMAEVILSRRLLFYVSKAGYLAEPL